MLLDTAREWILNHLHTSQLQNRNRALRKVTEVTKRSLQGIRKVRIINRTVDQKNL